MTPTRYTVLVCTRNDMEAMQEELFGPVSPVMAFDDFEEALALANDSKYGLSAYLFSEDARTVQRFAEGCKVDLPPPDTDDEGEAPLPLS